MDEIKVLLVVMDTGNQCLHVRKNFISVYYTSIVNRRFAKPLDEKLGRREAAPGLMLDRAAISSARGVR
jgi:hypothetical protein